MPGQSCIILVGMPAAGKSTVGILLAKRLTRPFVDVDVYIQAGTGFSLQEIIDRDGLDAFCRLESEYVRCLDLHGHVVATGGSVVYSEDAMQFLARAGLIVYLRLPLNAIRQRLGNFHDRGVVMPPGDTLETLYQRREPLYRKWADATVDCDGLTHDQVVSAVAAIVQNASSTKEPS